MHHFLCGLCCMKGKWAIVLPRTSCCISLLQYFWKWTAIMPETADKLWY
jgi:hypothetical protein